MSVAIVPGGVLADGLECCLENSLSCIPQALAAGDHPMAMVNSARSVRLLLLPRQAVALACIPRRRTSATESGFVDRYDMMSILVIAAALLGGDKVHDQACPDLTAYRDRALTWKARSLSKRDSNAIVGCAARITSSVIRRVTVMRKPLRVVRAQAREAVEMGCMMIHCCVLRPSSNYCFCIWSISSASIWTQLDNSYPGPV